MIAKSHFTMACVNGQELNYKDILLTPITINEGVQTTLEDIYRFEVSPDKETPIYDDIWDIIN